MQLSLNTEKQVATNDALNRGTSLGAFGLTTLLTAVLAAQEPPPALNSSPTPPPVTAPAEPVEIHTRGLNDQPAFVGHAEARFSVNGDSWVTPIIRVAGRDGQYAPISTFNCIINPGQNDALWGVDGKQNTYGRVGVTFKFAWAPNELLVLGAYLAQEQDRQYLAKKEIPSSSISVHEEQLKRAIIQAKVDGDAVGQWESRDLLQCDGREGVKATIYLPRGLAIETIACGGKNLTFSPYFAPYGREVANGTQSAKGSVELRTKVEAFLKNLSEKGKPQEILQDDVNQLSEIIQSGIFTDLYADSDKVLPLLETNLTTIMTKIIEARTLSGREAVELTNNPAYTHMMSTWLAGLQQELRLTDSTFKMGRHANGEATFDIDISKIIDAITENHDLAPVWGFMGGESFQKMSGSEKEKQIVKKIIEQCENQTGTTLQRVQGKPYFEIHKVRVHRLLENRNDVGAAISSCVALAVGELSGLRKGRDFDVTFNNQEIGKAITPQIEAAKSRSAMRDAAVAANQENLKKQALLDGRIKQYLADLHEIHEHVSALEEITQQPMSGIGVVATQNRALIEKYPSIHEKILQAEKTLGRVVGTRGGYSSVKGRMIQLKHGMDEEEAPWADAHWNRNYFDGLNTAWNNEIAAQNGVRDAARGELTTLVNNQQKALVEPALSEIQKRIEALTELKNRIQELTLTAKANPDSGDPALAAVRNNRRGTIDMVLLENIAAQVNSLNKLKAVLPQVLQAASAYYVASEAAITPWVRYFETTHINAGRVLAKGHGHISLSADDGGRDVGEANKVRDQIPDNSENPAPHKEAGEMADQAKAAALANYNAALKQVEIALADQALSEKSLSEKLAELRKFDRIDVASSNPPVASKQ